MAKSKQTKTLIKSICKLIGEGLSNKDSALAVGIAESTFYDWMNVESEFSESIKRAELKRKATLTKRILDASNKSWQAAAWYLERVYPDEFGKKENKDVSQASNYNHNTMNNLIVSMSEDERERVLQVVRGTLSEIVN